MKYLLFIALILLFSGCAAQGPGKARLYGFKQPVSGGAAPPRVTDENGKETQQTSRVRYNYFIYLEAVEVVYPAEIWLNGSAYAASASPVERTPVKQEGPVASGDTTVILVPATASRVLQLKTMPANGTKTGERGKILAKTNELVVVYKQGGKFFYGTVEKLKVLEALEMQ